MSETRSVRVVIRGRVQGVFYRAWTRERALHHGVAGWVRNRPDGAVEALVSGAPEAVERLLAECRRGPPAARVEDVAVEPAGPEDAGAGFSIVD